MIKTFGLKIHTPNSKLGVNPSKSEKSKCSPNPYMWSIALFHKEKKNLLLLIELYICVCINFAKKNE